jgi:hypothetical protein
MPALPAIHTIAPDAPVQTSSATQHSAEAPSHAANAAAAIPANSSSGANTQSSSDGRAQLNQKIFTQLQNAAAPTSTPLGSGSGSGAASSQSGNGSSANSNNSQNPGPAANSVTATTKSAAAPADSSTDSVDGQSPVPSSGTNSDAVAAAAIRAAGSATVAPLKSVSSLDAATASAAGSSAVAQALSAATAQQQTATAQSANAATADAKSFTPQLPSPAANAAPTPQQNAAALATPANSEMRVAMQTDLLGSIDLRAAIHQSTFSATIGVQREDVQALLANELPALQHALSERNLQVSQISVLHNSTTGSGSGMHDSRQSPHDPRQHQPRMGSATTMPYVQQIGSAFEDDARSALAESWGAAATAGNAGGLNILV